MAGILDYLSNRLNPSPMDMAQLQGGRSGILGQSQNQPQVSPINPADFQKPAMAPNGDFWSSVNPDGITQSILGGLLQYDPRQDMGRPENGGNRLATAGAALQDFSQTLAGKPPEYTNHLKDQLAAQITQQQKQVRDAALQKFSTATTPDERQSALMQFWASGGDASGLGSVLKSQQPQLRDIGANGSLAVIDPRTGLPTSVIHGTAPPQRPLISNGMQSLDNGKTWAPIPGYVAQQNAVSDARRPPPKAGAPGAINIPHPGSMY